MQCISLIAHLLCRALESLNWSRNDFGSNEMYEMSKSEFLDLNLREKENRQHLKKEEGTRKNKSNECLIEHKVF